MVLRLVVAYTRWVWGLSPAFVAADSEVWYPVMVFGMLVDAIAIAVLVAVAVCWAQSRREK